MTHTHTYAEQPFSAVAKVYDQQPMALHSHLADGKSPDGSEFSIDRSEPTHATFWITYKGQCYEIGIQEIVSGLLDVVDKPEVK